MTIKLDNLVKLFEILIVYACLFPNISFGLNKMDSQPWVLFLLFIYFALKLKFEKNHLFFLWFISLLVLILSTLYLVYDSVLHIKALIRAISNYTIVFFVWSFSIIINKKYNLINHYIIGSWVYTLYGLMQMYGFNYLDWISNNRTTKWRGVTSFASEPTYYALIIIFISWLIFNSASKIEKNNNNLFSIQNIGFFTIFINLISIFFIAKSATAILLLFVISTLAICFFINKKLLRFLIFSSITITFFIFVNFEEISRFRAMVIAMELYHHGFNSIHMLISNDASINGRVAQVFIPYIGLYENLGLPGGYFTFENISNKIINNDSFFWSEYGITAKIQSYIGVFIYELGVLGIIILFLMALILKNENYWKWREIIILFVTLLPSVPLGYGLVPLLFGSKCFKK